LSSYHRSSKQHLLHLLLLLFFHFYQKYVYFLDLLNQSFLLINYYYFHTQNCIRTIFHTLYSSRIFYLLISTLVRKEVFLVPLRGGHLFPYWFRKPKFPYLIRWGLFCPNSWHSLVEISWLKKNPCGLYSVLPKFGP